MFEREQYAAVALARSAAVELGKMFTMNPGELEVQYKTDSSAVTIIDRTIGEWVVRALHDEFPGDMIRDEDGGTVETASERRWWTDSFDGTANLPPQLRQSVVGVSFSVGGEVVVAAIGNPFEEKVVWAVRGEGAFVEPLYASAKPKRIGVSYPATAKERYAVVDAFFNEKNVKPKLAAIQTLAKRAMHVRMVGSNIYAIQLLAEGRVQFVLTDCVGGFWDIAPSLIVREAGGHTTDIRGEIPRPGTEFMIASSDPDHDGLRKELAAAGYASYVGFR